MLEIWSPDWSIHCFKFQKLILKHRENPRISWIFHHQTLRNPSPVLSSLLTSFSKHNDRPILGQPLSPANLNPPRIIGLRAILGNFKQFLTISQKYLTLLWPWRASCQLYRKISFICKLSLLARPVTENMNHNYVSSLGHIQGELGAFSTLGCPLTDSPSSSLIIKFSIPFQIRSGSARLGFK